MVTAVINLKTQEEIEIMRRAGNVVAQTLKMVEQTNLEGMTTAELDRLIEECIRSHSLHFDQRRSCSRHTRTTRHQGR